MLFHKTLVELYCYLLGYLINRVHVMLLASFSPPTYRIGPEQTKLMAFKLYASLSPLSSYFDKNNKNLHIKHKSVQ